MFPSFLRCFERDSYLFKSFGNVVDKSAVSCGWDLACGWDIAERLERLTANAVVATALGLIPASSDTVESEGRQMKQCWTSYIRREKIQKSLFKSLRLPLGLFLIVIENLKYSWVYLLKKFKSTGSAFSCESVNFTYVLYVLVSLYRDNLQKCSDVGFVNVGRGNIVSEADLLRWFDDAYISIFPHCTMYVLAGFRNISGAQRASETNCM